MRPNEHSRAKTFDGVALCVELVDRVVGLEPAIGQHAVETEPAAFCDRYRTGLVTPDEGPDALSVRVDGQGRGRSHLAASRKFCPFASRRAGAAPVRQSLDGAVRIVGGSLSEAPDVPGKQRCDAT